MLRSGRDGEWLHLQNARVKQHRCRERPPSQGPFHARHGKASSVLDILERCVPNVAVSRTPLIGFDRTLRLDAAARDDSGAECAHRSIEQFDTSALALCGHTQPHWRGTCTLVIRLSARRWQKSTDSAATATQPMRTSNSRVGERCERCYGAPPHADRASGIHAGASRARPNHGREHFIRCDTTCRDTSGTALHFRTHHGGTSRWRLRRCTTS